ncbi:MAG: hypothetical protein J5842_03415 [Lachnospiraceae bacterium]|nr:hypothetical protein [Lachnospiraceae bacterium]
MSTVYLPVGSKAAIPFVMQPLGIEVFTIEELCYFICREAELLEKSFMSAKLVDFIRRQLGLSDLAGQLSDDLANAESLAVFCGHIIDHVGYLDKNQRERLISKIYGSENAGELEKIQKKLNLLMENREYFALISQCEKILGSENIGFSREAEKFELEGAVLMKQAYAYAALFYFEPAAERYLKAHEAYEKADLTVYAARAAKDYLLCQKLLMDQESYKRFVEDNPQYVETSLVLQKNLDRAMPQIARSATDAVTKMKDPYRLLRMEYERM